MIPTAYDAFYATLFLRFLRRTYRKLSPGGPGEYTVVLGYEGTAYILGRFHSEGKAMKFARKAKAVLNQPVYAKNPRELVILLSNFHGKANSIFDADTMDRNTTVLLRALVLSANESQTASTTQP